MCTHIHTHTHMCTHIHTCVHTCTRVHTYAHVYTHTHTNTHTNTLITKPSNFPRLSRCMHPAPSSSATIASVQHNSVDWLARIGGQSENPSELWPCQPQPVGRGELPWVTQITSWELLWPSHASCGGRLGETSTRWWHWHHLGDLRTMQARTLAQAWVPELEGQAR